MIVPFLDGFLPFRKIPITWVIILFNMFIFSQNRGLSKICNEQFASWYEDKNFIYTQGQIYLQFKGEDSEVSRIKDPYVVGKLAFKDEVFLQKAAKGLWQGDVIAINKWREDIKQYLILRDIYPAFFFGVSGAHNGPFSFLSYQFFHEGLWHLLGNILLILLVGGFLERRYSGLAVFTTYIISGFLAAFVYSLTAHLTGAPLVGASGSLCGLLGFLFYTNFDEKTRLFYLILPTKNYMGFVKVQTCYWVIWFCMLEDIAGWVARPELFSGGIAHAIHLLGFLAGIGIGFVYLKVKTVSQPISVSSL